MSKTAMPVFPFKSFVIPHLMLMSLIHFAFILFTFICLFLFAFILFCIYFVREYSDIIHLHGLYNFPSTTY